MVLLSLQLTLIRQRGGGEFFLIWDSKKAKGYKDQDPWLGTKKHPTYIIKENIFLFIIIIVWANFALGSNSVKGKARPNVLCEGIRTSEDDQPRNE